MSRLNRWVPLAGVVYTVLLAVVLFATPSTPDVNASFLKITQFYSSHRGGLEVQVYLLAYCAVFAVVFFAVLAGYLRRMGAEGLARVAIGGAVVMAAGYGIGAATTAMLTHKSVVLNPGGAQALNLVNNDLPFIALAIGSLLAMIATGIAVISTKALPTWMGWVAIVSGVASGIGTFISFIGLMLGALWILVASVMLYQRMRAEADRPAARAGGSDRIPVQGEASAADSGLPLGG